MEMEGDRYVQPEKKMDSDLNTHSHEFELTAEVEYSPLDNSTYKEKIAIINEKEPDQFENCIHHWMLGSPQGGISTGICKKCGAERGFDEEKSFYRHGPKKARAIVINKDSDPGMYSRPSE